MKILTLAVLLCAGSTVFADDYSYDKVTIINTQLSISPLTKYSKDPAQKVFDDYWPKLVDSIPIQPNKLPFRQFKFQNNLPQFKPTQVKRQTTTVATNTETRTLYGVVNQTLITTGTVNGVTTVQPISFKLISD